MSTMEVSAIKIGQRHRQDMGDIDGLAQNIAEMGLLHPIVVTPGGKLIAGARRIQAFRKLGRADIPATVVDLKKIVRGEYAENFFRKAFAPSEYVAIADALEPAARVEAKERQREHNGTAPGKKHSGEVPHSVDRRALDHVAKIVGKDRKTIAKARAVVTAAKEDPARYDKVKEDMDRTGLVDRAYKQLQTTQSRAKLDETLARVAKAAPGRQTVVHADCREHLETMAAESVDVVVTSPPYNIGVEYNSHVDHMDRVEYLGWLAEVFGLVRRVMRPKGSFFLNVGNTSKDPWLETELAYAAMRGFFRLQNHIVWIKALAVDGKMFGHYKPVGSKRFLNRQYESIFHLTKEGDVEIDRLAVGVPFEDKSNIARRGHVIDLHCAGDTWFIQYDTVQSKADKFHHPASFPVELPERCIKLHGLRDDMVVLDPFAGSGSTLLAAKRLGCAAIGIESDDHYAKIAEMRLATDV